MIPSPDVGEGAADREMTVAPVRLGARTVRAGAVVAAGRVLQGVVSLASVAILARVLTPSEFGVLAMVLPLALIVGMTLNAGLHLAVLHEERLTPSQLNHLFWRAQRFNLALLGAMALSAPLLARLYREPRVTGVALAWTLALVFQALGSFPEALLKRQMRFAFFTALDVAGMLAGVAVAIAAASSGFHNVALVLQIVVWNAVRCVGAIAASGWVPRGSLRRAEPDPVVDRLVKYGADFGLARAVYWLGRQIDRMVVGVVSGATALGLYDGARRWSWYPFQELFLSITDVVVASLSRARHEPSRFREYARRGITAFLTLPMPAIAFVGVDAMQVIQLLLGDRWLGAVPLVRIMCAAAFVDSIGRLTGWLYAAEGKTRPQLVWSVVSTVVTLVAVVAVAPRGPLGVTWAFAASTVALAVPGIAYCLRTSVLTWRDFLGAVWRPAVATVVTTLVWMALRDGFPRPNQLLAGVVLDALAFVSLYAITWLMLPGGRRAMKELGEALRAIVTQEPAS